MANKLFAATATVALLAALLGGVSALAAPGGVVPANMVQAAMACYDTMVQNAESMATVFATGTPFSDTSCFVGCVKEILGPMAAAVEQQAMRAVRFVPPPLRQCAEIAVGEAAGASENECQRIIDAAQCVMGQAMAMLA